MSDDAVKLMIADKLENLERIQVDAIKNLKIDKITVWDNGTGENGKNATANFLSGIMKSIPPMNEVFDMAGMKLPEYLGTEKTDTPNEK
jgi:flotillin